MQTATTSQVLRKFRFREFQVYKDARELSTALRTFSRTKFPKEEQYALADQLWRALVSIILNIAEGADRSTDKDFALFLNRAHTSLNEVVACLDIALDNDYISQSEHTHYLTECAELGNQLTAFRATLLKSL